MLKALAEHGIAVPLLWRHRAPLIVLALVVAGVFACMATLKPGWTVVAVSAVAIYSVALYGDRLRTLATAARPIDSERPRGCAWPVAVSSANVTPSAPVLSTKPW